MLRKQKMELLKRKMRRDPEVKKLYFEQDETVIFLRTNRKMVIIKRKEIAQIINLLEDIQSPRKIEKIIKHYCYKILQEEVKVILKKPDKEKKEWNLLIKCQNTPNPAEES